MRFSQLGQAPNFDFAAAGDNPKQAAIEYLPRPHLPVRIQLRFAVSKFERLSFDVRSANNGVWGLS